MGLFSRRPAPTRALGVPGPGGRGWPEPARGSFASAALLQLGQAAAYEVEAHAVGDALVERVLPLVDVPVAPQDRGHWAHLLLSAVRLGAGLALAERGSAPPAVDRVERPVAAALWEARRGLPALPAEQEPVAAFALLAGFWVARQGPAAVDALRAALPAEGGG